MQVIFKRNMKKYDQMIRDLPGFYRNTIKEVADQIPEHVITNIEKQKTGIFEMGILKKNAPSTINRKRAQGKAPKSLIDTGKMTQKSSWKVWETASAFKVGLRKIQSKSGTTYNKIASYLHDKDYEFLNVPLGYVPKWIIKFVELKTKDLIKRYG